MDESVIASLGLSVSVRVIVRTRCIFWLRKPTLYPDLLRCCVSSPYVSLEEHIRRNLRARLNGKARLVCKR